MTKADLVKIISTQNNLDMSEVKKIIETFYKVIIDSMSAKEDVFLRGFGTFYNQKRAEKMARDIRRNKAVLIPSCYKPKFKPVKSFVEDVRNQVK
jgi:DNA-binding protein HU-beta